VRPRTDTCCLCDDDAWVVVDDLHLFYYPITFLFLISTTQTSVISDTVATAILRAAFGALEDLKSLVEDHGVDLINNAKDSAGWTALLYSSYHGNEANVQWLLKCGANVNVLESHAFSSLHLASYKGHVPTMKLLLEAGADVSQQNEAGGTALHMAFHFQGSARLEAAELLLDYGADLLVRDIN
jgi:ankyrin repeat protein